MSWLHVDCRGLIFAGRGLIVAGRVLIVAGHVLIVVYFYLDVDVEKPDEKSIMTYIAQFLKAYPEMGSDKPVVSSSYVQTS